MAIILAVIKWIGILIGIVLGIVVVLAACVVWVPVRYRAEAVLPEQGEKKYAFSVSFLFHLISIKKKLDSEKVRIRIGFITVKSKEEKEKKETKKMRKLKKAIIGVLASAMLMGAMTGCGKAASDDITVISREDGSGTRGAFIELFGIEEKDADGNKIDKTITTADITNSTSVMMTSVADDTAAIGYISLGSLDDSVKAVKIDGAEASAVNVSNGSYKVSRPFNIATKGTPNEVTQDFINFILSADGQAVVEEAGYISDGNTGAYTSAGVKGKINVAGSSSVTPVMEKLKEAYVAINPDVQIEVQQSDSTTGMTSAAEGVCDIGMASRELKDSELSAGLTPTVIATDGIAVIVNKDSSVDSLTSDQVKGIYTGTITKWSEVK